jgi:hypothetical protein
MKKILDLLKRNRIMLGAIFTMGAFSSLYLATRTWAFSYDALTAALTAERNGVFPFHPNHLFGSGLGWVFYQWIIRAGTPARALFVFQTVNAVTSGLTVGYFFYLLAKRFSVRAGILGAAGLGLSFAYWSESVDAGAYSIAGLLGVYLLENLLRLSQDRNEGTASGPLTLLAMGLGMGVAILVHQMFLLTLPSFLILLLFSVPPFSPQEKTKRFYLFVLGVFLTGILPYAVIAHSYYDFGLREGLFWFLGPAGPRPDSGILINSWWQWTVIQNVLPSWRGLVGCLAAPPPAPWGWLHPLAQGGLGVSLILFCLGSYRVYFQEVQKRPLLLAALAWILAMNIFQFFWAPGIIRFRLLFLPILFVWGLLSLDGLPDRGKKYIGKSSPLFLFLILGFGLSNAVGTIIPSTRIENNRSIVRTLWIGQTVGPNDFFLFSGSGDSVTNVVPPYFAPHVPSRSLYGYFFANPSGNFSEIAVTIEQTLRQGGSVYIEEPLFRKEAWKGLARDEAMAVEILSKWFSRYERDSVLEGPFNYSVAKIRNVGISNSSAERF